LNTPSIIALCALLLCLDACGGGGGGTSQPAASASHDPPVIQSSLSTTAEASVTAKVVTENDGDTYTTQVVSPPAHGTVTLDGPVATYQPGDCFSGVDSFQLRATDSKGASATGTVSVTVAASNRPTAAALSVHTVQGQGLNIDVLSSATLSNPYSNAGNVTVSVINPPGIGTAAQGSGQSIRYIPTSSFVGTTSLDYQIKDECGLTASNTVSIAVSLTAGLLFTSTQDNPSSPELFFTDGAQTIKISAPLASGEQLVAVTPAAAAPLVLYTTQLNNSTQLYMVDLRHPAQVMQLGTEGQGPVLESVVSADGSVVAFQTATGLRVLNTANPGEVFDVGSGGRGLTITPDGSDVIYAVTPQQQPSALYRVASRSASAPVRVTPLFAPPDSVGDIVDLSFAAKRLYYTATVGGSGALFVVDPYTPGSDALVFADSVAQIGFNAVSADQTTFYGLSLGNGRPDVYGLKVVPAPGTPTNLTSGTANGQIYRYVLSDDASAFYYLRSDAGGRYSLLYSVNPAAPAVSTRIGPTPSTLWGINDFALAHDGQALVYSTLDWTTDPATDSQLAGPTEVYVLTPANGASSSSIKHFAGAGSIVGPYALDNSFVVIAGASQPGSLPLNAFVVNLRDTTQVIPLNTGGTFTQAYLVPLPY
jgi:hypothetical protein